MADLFKLVNLLLKENAPTKQKIEWIKKTWAKENKVGKLILNSEILEALGSWQLAVGKANKSQKLKTTTQKLTALKKALITKPTRTLSGVSVVAIMSKPAPCPGNCHYCPVGENAPKSYVGFEPAALRAKLNKYDPYKQVTNRLTQLENVGHATDKNELIIMGGTFPSLSWNYQVNFIKGAFDGFNSNKSENLREAHKKNEKAKRRVIGLTIETRPDYIYIDKLLALGATRVEIGVQNTDDKILEKVNRGHSVEETIIATKILKDAGFKVLYHVMPGLPGSSFKKDVEMFKEIFTNPRFKPDMLKIYPTLVIKGTKLYNDWKNKKYKAIDEEYMNKLLINVLKICPSWVRIMRVQRDIPAKFIEAGPKKSNLREIIQSKTKTKEIRFREVGHVFQRTGKWPEKVGIKIKKYRASKGKEYFISAEDKNILVGFCRLRICNRPEAMLRELHVYGSVTPIGLKGEIQHKGWGRKLLKTAEQIAKKEGKKEMNVISGIGVREYYRKHGYELKDSYMWKKL